MEQELLAIGKEICAVGALLYSRGYVVSNDGNISVRVGENRVLMTPSGVGKGRMTPEMMVLLDLDGNILEGERYPSSESRLHLMLYRESPEIQAAVHAHPPCATAFAVCRKPLSERYLSEMILGLGEIPVAPFAMLSTDEVPESVRPFVHSHKAVLLANHGALTWSKSLQTAFDQMEIIEQTAQVSFYVSQLGGGVEITKEQADTLCAKQSYYAGLAGVRH